MEVTIAVANAMLSFVLKCENPKQAPSFLKHFFKTLVRQTFAKASNYVYVLTFVVLQLTILYSYVYTYAQIQR